jgi:hypothetical protein
LSEVEETIVNIEAAIRRAERAEAALRTGDAQDRLILALSTARQELIAVRRRLQQSAYLAAEEAGGYADQVPMFEVPDGDDDQPGLL